MSSVLEKWAEKLGERPIPVLKHTIAELNRLCQDDNLPMAELAHTIEQDPGLTVQLLRICNSQSHGRFTSEINSVQQALMMMGIERIRRLPSEIPSVEDTLQNVGRQQILSTFSRAYHAACQATEWARQRRDMTPDEVYAATLLHFIGEMVLSLYAPEKLQEIYSLRNEERVASAEAQYVVLGFTLDQLSTRLAQMWNLPQLVIDALRPENAQFPRAYGVMLGVQLVRVGQYDWYGEKARAINEEIAAWLNLPMDQVVRESHQLAVEIARKASFYEVVPAAFRLLYPVKTEDATKERTQDEQADINPEVGLCLTPQVGVIKSVFDEIGKAIGNNVDREKILRMATEGMHDGIGLNRVVFAKFDAEKNALFASTLAGADNDPIFNRFQIKLNLPHLFTRILEKPQALWMNDSNRGKFWSMVPSEIQKLIATNTFFCMSVHVAGKPFGMFYADRHTSACQLDEASYKYFKALTTQASKALQPGS